MLTQTPAEPRRSQSRSIRERRFPDWHGLLYGPFLWSVLACFALAAISAAVLPTVPSYDPWAWISWGREVTDPHLSFAITGGTGTFSGARGSYEAQLSPNGLGGDGTARFVFTLTTQER